MADGRVIIDTELNTKPAEKSASSLGNTLKGGLTKGVKATAGAITAVAGASVAGAGAMVKMAKATAETGDHIDKMSQKMGMSAEAYQKWDYVAKISGTSIDRLKMGFKTLTNTIDSANKGNDKAVKKFQAIGVSMDDLKNKSREQIFEQTIKGLQNVTNETERSALANQLLGRAGMELGPMLNSTNADLDKLMRTAEEYGMIMSEKAVKASAKFQDSVTTMQGTLTGLKNRMTAQFLPALTQVTDGLALVFKGDTDNGLEKIDKGIKGLTDGIVKAVPKILKVGGSIIGSLGKAIWENLPQLLTIGTQMAGKLFDGIFRAIPQLLIKLPKMLGEGLESIDLSAVLKNLINKVIDTTLLFLESVPSFLKLGVTFITSLVDSILQAIPEFARRLPEIVGGLISTIIGSIDVIIDGLLTLVDSIVSNLPTIIGSLITGIIESLPLIVGGLIELVGKLVTRLPEIIMGIILAIPKMISQFFEAITNEENIEKWIVGFAEMNKKIFSSIPEIMKYIFIKIPKMISSFFSKLGEKIPDIMTKIGDFIGKIVDKIPSVADKFKTWVESLPDKIDKWLEDLPQHIYDLMKYATERGIDGILVAGKTVDLMKKAREWMTKNLPVILVKIAKAGSKIGLAIIQGIGKGMASAREWLVKKAMGIVGKMVDGVKDFLGIHSPSRLMRDDVGKMMALGIYEGFDDNNPLNQINKDLKAGIGAIETSINLNNALNYQRLGEAVRDGIANSNLGISLDGREFGRVVRSV